MATSTDPGKLGDRVLSTASARGHLMNALRSGDPEREALARRDLAAAGVARVIKKALADAPPLTPNQIAKLTALLKAAGQ